MTPHPNLVLRTLVVLGWTAGAAAVCAQPSAVTPASAQQVATADALVLPPTVEETPRPAGRKPPETSLSTDDLRFVDEALMASELEIAAGQLALKTSTDPKVQAYARQMMKDHADALAELRRIATAKGVTPQKRVPEPPELVRLRALKPQEFDQVYIRTVAVDAHEQAVLLFQNQATRGRDPALRAYAHKRLPAPRENLRDGRAMTQQITVNYR